MTVKKYHIKAKNKFTVDAVGVSGESSQGTSDGARWRCPDVLNASYKVGENISLGI